MKHQIAFENEEKASQYLNDEITITEEIAYFEKHVRAQAKKVISKYKEGIEITLKKKFSEKIDMLNEQQ